MSRRFLPAAAALMLVGVLATTAPAKSILPWIEVTGFPNGRYLAIPPSHPAGEKWPVLFAAHGWGGEAFSYGRLWHEALAGRYLVIAPQAVPKQRAGAAVSTWDGHETDRAFLLAVWDDAWRKHPMIDPSRVVVAGYSSGGRAAGLLVTHRRAQINAVVFHATPASVDEEALVGKHVFLIAGERDSGFNAAKAGARRDALFRRGVDVTLFVAPGETHASVYDNVREAARWMLNAFKVPENPPP